MARMNGFDSEPDSSVLERLNALQRARVIDIEDLKKYLRIRLREERVSIGRVAKAMGTASTVITHLFQNGASVSLERLEQILYIVDGTADLYMGRTNEPNERTMEINDFLDAHPDANAIDEWDVDDWIIGVGIGVSAREFRYNKRDYSLKNALYRVHSNLMGNDKGSK